jgi:hypothetical protein
MSKRLSDEECIELFTSLPLSHKRQLLESYIPPTDVRLFRDIIHLISRYTDMQTWGRLKQSCKLFHTALILHPLVLEIQQRLLLDPPVSYIGTEQLFFPYMRRLLYFLKDYDDKIQQDLVNRPDDQSAHYNLQRWRVNLEQCLTKLRQFRGKKWIDFIKFRVCYPQGFICPLDSFRSIGNIYVDPLESLFDVNEYAHIITKHARSVPKDRYENCKNHMNFINEKKG